MPPPVRNTASAGPRTQTHSCGSRASSTPPCASFLGSEFSRPGGGASPEAHRVHGEECAAHGIPLLDDGGRAVNPLGFAKRVVHFQLGQQLRSAHSVHLMSSRSVRSTAAAYGPARHGEMPPITPNVCRLTRSLDAA